MFAFHALETVAVAQSPCLLNPCQNGGKCEVSKDAPGGYQCICLEPYGGRDCTIENPTCVDQPCLNGGACEDMPNQQFKCICPPGFAGGLLESSSGQLHEMEGCWDVIFVFAGLRCEFEDPCLVKPCKNGARCFSNNLGKRECQCPAGFTGEDCSVDVNECEIEERSPCEQNGTCINEAGISFSRFSSGYIRINHYFNTYVSDALLMVASKLSLEDAKGRTSLEIASPHRVGDTLWQRLCVTRAKFWLSRLLVLLFR